ncbi:MAG TPA: hypothetical protein VJL29_06140 [Thermoguttaceae bacterium]|nr:hypothetical protein [Thermoguttaceae bacterium]
MCKVLQSTWIVFCAVLCTATASRDAVAEVTLFVNPTRWSVGDANSTYQEWDVFLATSNNAPDVGHFPASLAPTFSASPAIVTTTKSLYWYGGDYDWRADIQNYGGVGLGTDVIVQIASTLNNDGTGVLPNSLAIVHPDGSPILGGDCTSALRDTVLFEGDIWVVSQGSWVTVQERLWEFFLPDYTEDFRVTGTSSIHASLMRARVDSMISPVPEPGAAALAGSGLIGLGACRIVRRWRRRKNHSA